MPVNVCHIYRILETPYSNVLLIGVSCLATVRYLRYILLGTLGKLDTSVLEHLQSSQLTPALTAHAHAATHILSMFSEDDLT